jgi:hypothetical protein
MPRFGVLSDQATRQNFPEHQPIGLGKADFIHTVHLEKSPFTGIRVPKTTKSKFKHSRYASNDLNNYSVLTGGSYQEALDHFRRQFGRSNLELPKRPTKYESKNEPNHHVGNLSTRMNKTLSKLGDLDEFKSALDIKPYIHYNDGDILSKLNTMYRDNPQELNLIEQSYTEAGVDMLSLN